MGRQFFALLVLSSSGGSSLGSELVAFRPEARKTIKILKLWPANVKKHLQGLILLHFFVDTDDSDQRYRVT